VSFTVQFVTRIILYLYNEMWTGFASWVRVLEWYTRSTFITVCFAQLWVDKMSVERRWVGLCWWQLVSETGNLVVELLQRLSRMLNRLDQFQSLSNYIYNFICHIGSHGKQKKNSIVGLKCTLAASHAAPVMSHVEYAWLALLRLEKRSGQTDRQTDGWTVARPLRYAFR